MSCLEIAQGQSLSEVRSGTRAAIKKLQDLLTKVESLERSFLNLDLSFLDELNLVDFTNISKTPGGIECGKQTLPSGEEYYSIRSLRDLKNILDLEDMQEHSSTKGFRKVFYLKKPRYNRGEFQKFQFDAFLTEIEGSLVERAYFVQDIEQWVMVEVVSINYNRK